MGIVSMQAAQRAQSDQEAKSRLKLKTFFLSNLISTLTEGEIFSQLEKDPREQILSYFNRSIVNISQHEFLNSSRLHSRAPSRKLHIEWERERFEWELLLNYFYLVWWEGEMSFYETKWDDGVRQDFIFTIQRY